MKREPADILKDALELPPEVRGALAGSLIDSLDDHVDHDVEDTWAEEIHRRLAELDSGTLKLISWTETRRRLSGP